MAAIVSTFKTHEPGLHELLDDIHNGTIQLPDFQRGWVWDEDHIRALLASVSLSYPIGAVMLMETGGNGVRFKPRPLEGVRLTRPTQPQQLILDGQQRLTSLYAAIRSGQPVSTRTSRDESIERFYYLDISKCLDAEADRLDAIVTVPASRVRRTDFNRKIELDLSTREGEYNASYFPIGLIFDTSELAAWRRGYYLYDSRKAEAFDRFERDVISRFHQYRIPIILLLQNTPKEAVCQVFENVNTGGVSLTVFELVTATFAADDFNLREDWERREEHFKTHPQLQELAEGDFLVCLTLLSSCHRSRDGRGFIACRRKDVLGLSLEDYRQYGDQVEWGFREAACFLDNQGVYDRDTLPYRTQLIPFAALFALLGTRTDEEEIKQKLARWFWCGVFGELYSGPTETLFVSDLQEVPAWLEGGPEPRVVRNANFAPTRLLGLQTRQSAAYKGMIALLMKHGSRDLVTSALMDKANYFDLAVDIHHLFPKTFCEKRGYDRSAWNSVINKAPLAARSGRHIGSNAPSSYLASLEKTRKLSPDHVDQILRTNLVEPHLLRGDDFDNFLRARARKLLDLIETATGKPIPGRDSEEVVKAFRGPLTRA